QAVSRGRAVRVGEIIMRVLLFALFYAFAAVVVLVLYYAYLFVSGQINPPVGPSASGKLSGLGEVLSLMVLILVVGSVVVAAVVGVVVAIVSLFMRGFISMLLLSVVLVLIPALLLVSETRFDPLAHLPLLGRVAVAGVLGAVLARLCGLHRLGART